MDGLVMNNYVNRIFAIEAGDLLDLVKSNPNILSVYLNKIQRIDNLTEMVVR